MFKLKNVTEWMIEQSIMAVWDDNAYFWYLDFEKSMIVPIKHDFVCFMITSSNAKECNAESLCIYVSF